MFGFAMRMRQVEEEELTVKLQTAGLLLRQQMLSSEFLLLTLNLQCTEKEERKECVRRRAPER
jgi:hypothetical protein